MYRFLFSGGGGEWGVMLRVTRFRLLIQQRHLSFATFLIHFGRSSLELARLHDEPRLANLTISSRTYDRWMTGDIKGLPAHDVCRVLEHMFDVAAEVLFATVHADSTPLSGAVPLSQPAEQSALAGADLWDSPGRIRAQTKELFPDETEAADVHLAQAAIERVVQQYEVVGPERLGPEVRIVRRMLHGLLRGRQSQADRQQVCRLAARVSGLLGYMAVNTGSEAAFAYCEEAVALAREINDNSTIAWALGTTSLGLYYAERYAEADAAAAAGVGLAPASPQAIRLLVNGRARALARLGDRKGAVQAIGQALELSDRQPGLVSGLTSCISFEPYGMARTLSNALTAYVSLADTARAGECADAVDAHVMASDSAWSKALVRLDVASSVLQGAAPDVEHAMQLGHEALDAAAGKPIQSILKRARELRVQASRWDDLHPVREFDERLSSLTMSRSSE
ncbi:hypothetical protein [Streptosporangium sp. CA-115845]|uniref:hypothetical protein n=1 Tax=Streptosporangium sp. CA-115845 TaxID=3240071 RepID=UPI003D903D20